MKVYEEVTVKVDLTEDDASTLVNILKRGVDQMELTEEEDAFRTKLANTLDRILG